ncbi:MAG: hypothetical protein ACI9MR_003375 [Myxococcota bacterium]|jgi:hypothetical protein
MRITAMISVVSVALLTTACSPDDTAAIDPVEVAPAETIADSVFADAPPVGDTAPRPGVPTGGGLQIEDANGQFVGVLIRRGSDDNVANRAIYDLVTLYHPGSGLFFDVTMSDAVIRYPATTLFDRGGCDVPVGISSGGCRECRAGFGTGIFHAGRWWRVRGGELEQQISAGASIGGGLSTTCVAHGTNNARAFTVVEVAGEAPPTSLLPPLRYVWK